MRETWGIAAVQAEQLNLIKHYSSLPADSKFPGFLPKKDPVRKGLKQPSDDFQPHMITEIVSEYPTPAPQSSTSSRDLW